MIVAMGDRLTELRASLLSACQARYEKRLVSLAIFGSWARRAATPASDIDVLLVASSLPPSRRKRVAEFELVERDTASVCARVWPEYQTAANLSPVLKTPDEVDAGSPLFLDMTEWCDLLWDPEGFLAGYLGGLRSRMAGMGAQRLARKGGYCWQYKPDIGSREVVTL